MLFLTARFPFREASELNRGHYFLLAAEEALDCGADAFDHSACALHALAPECAQSFGDVLDADSELSRHGGCDAGGQTLVKREVRIAGMAFKSEVNVDGVVIV